MTAQMQIRVLDDGPDGLRVALPLDPNRNHQQTAFAGSLNALCTIAGWCTTYLLLEQIQGEGAIVIRRSSIKYLVPVQSDRIIARCAAVTPDAADYFTEMFREKNQAKLDLAVEITHEGEPAVVFGGSYVVVPTNS